MFNGKPITMRRVEKSTEPPLLVLEALNGRSWQLLQDAAATKILCTEKGLGKISGKKNPQGTAS